MYGSQGLIVLILLHPMKYEYSSHLKWTCLTPALPDTWLLVVGMQEELRLFHYVVHHSFDCVCIPTWRI
jgi:hypothetical protein